MSNLEKFILIWFGGQGLIFICQAIESKSLMGIISCIFFILLISSNILFRQNNILRYLSALCFLGYSILSTMVIIFIFMMLSKSLSAIFSSIVLFNIVISIIWVIKVFNPRDIFHTYLLKKQVFQNLSQSNNVKYKKVKSKIISIKQDKNNLIINNEIIDNQFDRFTIEIDIKNNIFKIK